MGSYHIGKNGPAPCSAPPGSCPLGGDHFRNFLEANWAFEEIMSPMLHGSQVSGEFNLENEVAANQAAKVAAQPKPRAADDFVMPEFTLPEEIGIQTPAGTANQAGERVL